MPPLKNYDYDPEKVFYLNTYDYSYSNVIEKFLLKLSTKESRLNLSLIEITSRLILGPPLKIKFLKNPGAVILYMFLK
jgi:hypothetical protein